MSNFDQRGQQVNTQFNTVIGQLIHNPNPIEKVLIAELMTSLVIQGGIILLSLMSSAGFNCIVCSPLSLVNAIFALIMGNQLKNKVIIQLSVILGITTVGYWVLFFIMITIYSVIGWW
jgi:hypothetical protein